MSLEVGDLASAVNCTPMKAAVLAQVADGWVGPPAVPQFTMSSARITRTAGTSIVVPIVPESDISDPLQRSSFLRRAPNSAGRAHPLPRNGSPTERVGT